MKSAKIGRTVGILLLLHLITGLMVPYMMLQQLTRPLTFAESNLANSFQVRLAVMLLFVGGAMTIAIAITGMPVFRKSSYALALWLVALAIGNFSLQGAENAATMSLFTFSQTYVDSGAADIVGATVRSAWRWIHYTHLLVVVSWMFLLGVMLWRSALVPRVFAILLLITTLLQITGITLPQFLAYPSPNLMLMGMPLGFVYLALSVWLMLKGFRTTEEVATT
ncbi:MAG TPA: DUF4386 family protein [Pyrinomonadaceae bacterium]|nr:DUF4386 family protein [Pyrinomonadaceae bacterium]